VTTLRVVPDEPPEAPADHDEAVEIVQDAWAQARKLHVRLLAQVAEPGILRLQNGGALPHEDRDSRSITIYTLSGIAKDMRKIGELATEAAHHLDEAVARIHARER
jgi:hypothetical protein